MAHVVPVFVGGVTVSNVTLHIWTSRRKDVRMGDTVVVRRAGDVIPEIVRVIQDSDHKMRATWVAERGALSVTQRRPGPRARPSRAAPADLSVRRSDSARSDISHPAARSTWMASVTGWSNS